MAYDKCESFGHSTSFVTVVIDEQSQDMNAAVLSAFCIRILQTKHQFVLFHQPLLSLAMLHPACSQTQVRLSIQNNDTETSHTPSPPQPLNYFQLCHPLEEFEVMHI